jgi:hypothetical protein
LRSFSPSESSASSAEQPRYRRCPCSYRIGISSRVSRLLRQRPYWLSAPTSSLGFPSTLRSFRSRLRRKRLSIPTATLCEFGLRLEQHRRHLVGLPKQGQHLSWALLPYSTSRNEGPLAAGFACPLRSALRVWLPSRRFPPFEPLPALFRAGSAPGIHPSELSPLERHPRVSARMNPHTVSPHGYAAAKQRPSPSGRGSWALILPRVPGDPTRC